jgi:hypothetical protein
MHLSGSAAFVGEDGKIRPPGGAPIVSGLSRRTKIYFETGPQVVD